MTTNADGVDGDIAPIFGAIPISTLRTVRGDLMHCDAQVMVQQNNCITCRPHGLSEVIKKRFGVDIYSERRCLRGNLAVVQDRAIPGHAIWSEIPTNGGGRYVVGLLGKFAPGKPLV